MEEHIKKNATEITLKQLEKWKMHENFIEALLMLETDKIFKFKVVYRKGELNYSIEESFYDFEEDRISKDDIELINNYFFEIGYEVNDKYIDCTKVIKKLKNRSGFERSRNLIGIYIKGKK